METLPEHRIAGRHQVDVAGAQAVVVQEHHIGMIGRHIAYHMSQRQTVERLPELRNRLTGAAGDIFLVNPLEKGEYSRVAPHQRLQRGSLPSIGQLDVIERLTLNIDPHLRRDVYLL